MNQGRTILELEQATSVPAGSSYVMESGDGSGSKRITHEQMVKAVGDSLPLGDTADLKTNAKDNFVNAINELKDRTDSASGGSTIRVLTEDATLYGATVTVTDGVTTLTGSMSSAGECVIAGITMAGSLTVKAIAATGESDSEIIYVDNYATYTVHLDSTKAWNYINVTTAESSLYGREVTVYDGTNTASGTIGGDGTARIKFDFAGTVYVTASDGENTVNVTVQVAEGGGAEQDINMKLYHMTVNTVESTLDGKIITLSRGNYSRSAYFIDGSAQITFDDLFVGECTLSASDGTKQSTDKITVASGSYTYEVSFDLSVTYTVIIDYSKSVPGNMITYADDAEGMEKDYSAWAKKEIFNVLRPCVLVDGVVQYYLNPDNLTQKEDGTAADITTLGYDVMLEIPTRLGYLIEWDNSAKTILRVSVTNKPNAEGYNYDAFSLDAYNDCDKIYIGVYKGHCSGNKAYSSSGKAVTVSQTIDTFRTWCRARGDGYQQRTYASVKLMQCLYIISHGNLDSQTAVGYGYVLSSNTAGVVTGGTNAYGADSEVIRATNPAYLTDQKHQVKCLNLEDFWGNYWEFVDGLCSDASRNVLTCQCAADFDTEGDGYENNGNGGVTANIGNYMKLPQGGSNAGFTARDVTGSSSTYHCDSAYLSASCLAIFGGGWNNGAYAGAFPLLVNYAFSLSSASVGCRLMYLHKEEAA